MGTSTPREIVDRDRVLTVLKVANRPLTVAQIASQLKSSNVGGAFPSVVRSILYSELLPQRLVEHDSSYRWMCARGYCEGAGLPPHTSESQKSATAPTAARQKPIRRSAGAGINTKTIAGKRPSRRTCERCGGKPVSGERFCRKCRKALLAELQEAGYLTAQVRGHVGDRRSDEMRENVEETKHGKWHG